jgi:hypothetical protein
MVALAVREMGMSPADALYSATRAGRLRCAEGQRGARPGNAGRHGYSRRSALCIPRLPSWGPVGGSGDTRWRVCLARSQSEARQYFQNEKGSEPHRAAVWRIGQMVNFCDVDTSYLRVLSKQSNQPAKLNRAEPAGQ